MPQIISIILFFVISFLSFLFSISHYLYFAPQLIAIISVAILILYFTKKTFSLHLVALLINVIIFSTNGLNSSFFFLIYFFLCNCFSKPIIIHFSLFIFFSSNFVTITQFLYFRYYSFFSFTHYPTCLVYWPSIFWKNEKWKYPHQWWNRYFTMAFSQIKNWSLSNYRF